jgi:hypothetical protein
MGASASVRRKCEGVRRVSYVTLPVLPASHLSFLFYYLEIFPFYQLMWQRNQAERIPKAAAMDLGGKALNDNTT